LANKPYAVIKTRIDVEILGKMLHT